MFVYLIGQTGIQGLYKIGYTSKSVETRLKQLQTGCPVELFIQDKYQTEYASQVEALMHTHFKFQKFNNEWFDLSKEDVQKFQHLCKNMEERYIAITQEPEDLF